MLRKITRSISRGRERDPSPEFVSKGAAEAEARARSRDGNRASHHREARRFSFEAQQETSPEEQLCPFYLDSTLEALSLEPMIKPTLTRMRPTLEHADKLLLPPPRRQSEPSHVFPMPPPRVHQAKERTRVGEDTVILRAPIIPELCVTPPAEDYTREVNPYEQSLAEEGPFTVTPLPSRPLLRRSAVSYRTQRELPLRVQAVRRSHQEQFALQIMQRSPILPTMRRASVAGPAPTPPPKTPLPRPPLAPRSRSAAPSAERGRDLSPRAPIRKREASRSRSRPPVNRLPSVQEDYPYKDAPDVPDWYLQAALSDWSFEG